MARWSPAYAVLIRQQLAGIYGFRIGRGRKQDALTQTVVVGDGGGGFFFFFGGGSALVESTIKLASRNRVTPRFLTIRFRNDLSGTFSHWTRVTQLQWWLIFSISSITRLIL